MSQHLAALQFKESPDYAKLQGWLAQLTSADATRLLQPPPGVPRPQNGVAVGVRSSVACMNTFSPTPYVL